VGGNYKLGDGPLPWLTIVAPRKEGYSWDSWEHKPGGVLVGRVFLPWGGFFGVAAGLWILLGILGGLLQSAVLLTLFVLTLVVALATLVVVALVALFKSWAALSRDVYENEKGGRR